MNRAPIVIVRGTCAEWRGPTRPYGATAVGFLFPQQRCRLSIRRARESAQPHGVEKPLDGSEGRDGALGNFGRWAPILLVVLSGILFLPNLGNHLLWQDEAQTALIATTVQDHGVPRGFDGRNYFSQELGAEYGENYIWRWHTWLPFYLVAVSFEILGQGTMAARLPFALFGIATVILLYYFAADLWRD